MSNDNLANAEKSLTQVNMGNIQVTLQQGKNPKQCTRVEFKQGDVVKSISTSAFYGSQFLDLFTEIATNGLTKDLTCSKAESKQERAWQGGSRDTQIRTYAKDSYQQAKKEVNYLIDNDINKRLIADCDFTNIRTCLNSVLEQHGMTIDMFKKYGIDCKKTSAFLINDLYITPSIVAVVLKEFLNTKYEQIDCYIKNHNITKENNITLIQSVYKHALLNNKLRELRG